MLTWWRATLNADPKKLNSEALEGFRQGFANLNPKLQTLNPKLETLGPQDHQQGGSHLDLAIQTNKLRFARFRASNIVLKRFSLPQPKLGPYCYHLTILARNLGLGNLNSLTSP